MGVPVIQSHSTVMKGALIVAVLISVAVAVAEPEPNADPWLTYSAYGGHGGYGLLYRGYGGYGGYGLYTGYGGYGIWGKKKRSAEPEPVADPEPWVTYGRYGLGHGGYRVGYGGLYGGYGRGLYGGVYGKKKRSAEPEPVAEPEPWVTYGRYGLGHGGYRLGFGDSMEAMDMDSMVAMD